MCGEFGVLALAARSNVAGNPFGGGSIATSPESGGHRCLAPRPRGARSVGVYPAWFSTESLKTRERASDAVCSLPYSASPDDLVRTVRNARD